MIKLLKLLEGGIFIFPMKLVVHILKLFIMVLSIANLVISDEKQVMVGVDVKYQVEGRPRPR